MRVAFTPLTCSSWYAQQALPASISSLVTVLRETPVTRVIARMDDPSQSIERIWTRLARGSLFMRGIIPARAYSVKHKFILIFGPSTRPSAYLQKDRAQSDARQRSSKASSGADAPAIPELPCLRSFLKI